MQGVRLPLHQHAVARQTSGDEGTGGLAVCDGQRQLWHVGAAVRGERGSRVQMDTGRSGKYTGTLRNVIIGDRAD